MRYVRFLHFVQAQAESFPRLMFMPAYAEYERSVNEPKGKFLVVDIGDIKKVFPVLALASGPSVLYTKGKTVNRARLHSIAEKEIQTRIFRKIFN